MNVSKESKLHENVSLYFLVGFVIFILVLIDSVQSYRVEEILQKFFNSFLQR